MRGTLILLIATVLIAGASPAGAQVPTECGETSLLFRLMGLSSLSLEEYEGGIGVRHFISDRTALVPVIRFGLVDSQRDSEREESARARVQADSQSTTSIGLGLAIEKHFGVGKVVPYGGGGLAWSYRKLTQEQAVAEGDRELADYRTDQDTHVLELFGSLGFQWAAVDGLLLGAEYRLGIGRGWDDQTNQQAPPGRDTITNTVSQSFWDVGISTLSVTLAVVLP